MSPQEKGTVLERKPQAAAPEIHLGSCESLANLLSTTPSTHIVQGGSESPDQGSKPTCPGRYHKLRLRLLACNPGLDSDHVTSSGTLS